MQLEIKSNDAITVDGEASNEDDIDKEDSDEDDANEDNINNEGSNVEDINGDSAKNSLEAIHKLLTFNLFSNIHSI